MLFSRSYLFLFCSISLGMFCYLRKVTLKMSEGIRGLVCTTFSWMLLNPWMFLAASDSTQLKVA